MGPGPPVSGTGLSNLEGVDEPRRQAEQVLAVSREGKLDDMETHSYAGEPLAVPAVRAVRWRRSRSTDTQ
jgi:hypothetical protein